MKLLCLFALAAATAFPESHPAWWIYASPEATALVGIHWENLRNSPFAPVVEAELSSTGPLAFPDLECLRNARDVIISSPELLAAEAGSFPPATVTAQAQHAGLRRVVYKGLTLWVPEKAAALGIAQISEQLVLVGARKTLQSAIDLSLLESGRPYSGLLPKAARFSQTGDLWVVAVKLPDDLASLFVPLDAEGVGFLGQVSVRNGLFVEASFDASSTKAAAAIATNLAGQAQSLPGLGHNLQASSDRRTVNIQLQATAEELAASVLPAAPVSVLALRPAPSAVAAIAPAKSLAPRAPKAESKPVPESKLPAAEPKPEAAKPSTELLAAAPVSEPVAVTAPKPPEESKPEQPQVIHITGLDEGPREIPLPPLPRP